MTEYLANCIVFFKPEKNIRPRKYRKCKASSFVDFCRRSGAWYINVYDEKKGFVKRIYVE